MNFRMSRWSKRLSTICPGCLAVVLFVGNHSATAAEKSTPPKVIAKQAGESHLPADKCRKMVVGPGVNQPDPFPGYAGFVGWECPARLRDGTMFVTFNAGYWHASLPTPVKLEPERLEHWKKAGMPADVYAPRGGRAMIVKSTDGGATWSKPRTLIDTPYDDRHPAMTELSDGTFVCTLFTFPDSDVGSDDVDPSKGPRIGVIRSLDGGQTWEQKVRRMPPGFTASATDGPVLELPDGTILLAGEGHEKSGRWVIGVLRSKDRGATWQRIAKVKTDHDQYEPTMARLTDGTLVMITRPEGAITFSSDNGQTWTEPVTFGFRLFAPTLLVLADGTLLCHYGSYNHGGLRAIFSTNGGHTWIAAAKDRGFRIDTTYGYSRSCLMPDGAAYLAYIGTGGHAKKDAENMIWSIRLRVRDNHSGIELLPVTGGPAK